MDVYVLASPRDGMIRYVGLSKDWKKRTKRHCRPPTPSERLSNGRLACWKCELLEQGMSPDAFQISMDLTLAEAQAMEKGYIKTFREAGEPLLNVHDGGTYGNNHSPSAETRARLREANLGKKMSPEAIAKTRAAHLGSKRSSEICAKFAAIHVGQKVSAMMLAAAIVANTGRHPSPETRVRLSAAQRLRNQRNPMTTETKAKIAAAHRGKKISPGHLAKLRAGYQAWQRTGGHSEITPEHQAKMQTGHKAWAAKRAEERGAE